MHRTIVKIPSKARVLVVEDNPIRHAWFREKLPNYVSSVSAIEAIVNLETSRQFDNPFDVVFLDHDCVHRFVDPTEPDFLDLTFWKVAQYLARHEYGGEIIIHSGNPVGAARMGALVGRTANVSILPYGTFDIEVV